MRTWLFFTDILHVIVPVMISLVVTLYIYHFSEPTIAEKICRRDFTQNEQISCRPKCSHGEFSLLGSHSCRRWLTCEDIDKDVIIGPEIGHGLVKKVYLAYWNNIRVVLSEITDLKYKYDFDHGLEMLKSFQPNDRVVQMLGYCKRNSRIVTEHHQFQSADKLEMIYKSRSAQMTKYNTVTNRFQLCMDYVDILTFLHNSSLGTRVMCDSNDINKTTSQFLLTSDLRLVINDLDALPEVTKQGLSIKCGSRELFGNFVAPEQLWPFPDKEFNSYLQPGYNEKIDIWRIPDICRYFFGSRIGSDSLQFQLHRVHQNCKKTDPSARPSAQHIKAEYERVQRYLSLNKDKEL